MKKLLKVAAVAVAAMMSVALIAGCTAAGSASSASASSAPAKENVSQERAYPYTFTDMAGKQITLEKKVESVYIAGNVQPLSLLRRQF